MCSTILTHPSSSLPPSLTYSSFLPSHTPILFPPSLPPSHTHLFPPSPLTHSSSALPPSSLPPSLPPSLTYSSSLLPPPSLPHTLILLPPPSLPPSLTQFYDLLLKMYFIYIYIAPWQTSWSSPGHIIVQPLLVPRILPHPSPHTHTHHLFLETTVSAT